MTRFLSPEWLAELDAAIVAHPRLAALTADVRIVIEQRVTGTTIQSDSPDGDFTYHVVLDHGTGSVKAGPATNPTVTFSQDLAVARSIATGQESAQRAFMSGGLRVGGDLVALTAHQEVLAEVGDVFATVRSTTDFGTDLDSGTRLEE